MKVSSMDAELVLEDEIGELVIHPVFDKADTSAQTSISEQTSADMSAPAKVDPVTSSNIEELIASTAIEHALTDDTIAKPSTVTRLHYENTEISQLTAAIEQLVVKMHPSLDKVEKQNPQNQFATAVHLAKQKQDLYQAARWFRKAAMQGHAKAQFYLGVFFTKGQGVPKSFFHAYSWLSLAACQNLKEAAAAKKQLEPHLTAQEISAALKYAADLFEQMQVND